MNPRTPLTVLAAVFALGGVTLSVLYWRYRVTIRAYTPRWVFGVLRYSIPISIVLIFAGSALYLAFVGRFDQWSSPFGLLTLHDVSRAALVVWLVGMASLVLTLAVLIVGAVREGR